jgi:hypothetical protein
MHTRGDDPSSPYTRGDDPSRLRSWDNGPTCSCTRGDGPSSLCLGLTFLDLLVEPAGLSIRKVGSHNCPPSAGSCHERQVVVLGCLEICLSVFKRRLAFRRRLVFPMPLNIQGVLGKPVHAAVADWKGNRQAFGVPEKRNTCRLLIGQVAGCNGWMTGYCRSLLI